MEQNIKEKILEQYLQVGDAGRWTSQDICDNLRDMISLTPDEVTEYLTKKGMRMERVDDRLVWAFD